MTTPSSTIGMYDVANELGLVDWYTGTLSSQITLNDTNVRQLTSKNETWTTSTNFTSSGTYTVPSGVRMIKVVSNGKTKFLSVTPGDSLSVTVGTSGANNSVSSLQFSPITTTLGSWSGNVDAQILVRVQVATASGTAWSATPYSSGKGTYGAYRSDAVNAASAAGAFYDESSEGNHGDLGVTVYMDPLTTSDFIAGSQTFLLTNKNVRGAADITVQPNASNSYVANIYMTDGGYSEGYFYFNMALQYNTNIQIYTSPRTISLNDLRNKTWVTNYAGASSSTVTYNACFGYSIDRKYGGLKVTVGYWGNAGTGSWTQLRDYSGTGKTTNYSEVVQFTLTNSNAGILYATGASPYMTGPCGACIYSNSIYVYGQNVNVNGGSTDAPGAAWLAAVDWNGTDTIKIYLNPNRNGTGDTGTSISMSNLGSAFSQLTGNPYILYTLPYEWIT